MTYRNPPKKYQFKKGQSGNPKGRPRKKLQTGTTRALSHQIGRAHV